MSNNIFQEASNPISVKPVHDRPPSTGAAELPVWKANGDWQQPLIISSPSDEGVLNIAHSQESS